MKVRLALYFFVGAFAFLLAACDSGKNNSQPHSSTLGVRVETPDGSYTNISPLELNALLADKTFSFINVHIPYEGELEKTDAFIPFDEIEKNLDQLPKDKSAQIVLYCRSGRMSQEAANTLVKLGFTNVWNLDRGMIGWEQAGLPIVVENQQE